MSAGWPATIAFACVPEGPYDCENDTPAPADVFVVGDERAHDRLRGREGDEVDRRAARRGLFACAAPLAQAKTTGRIQSQRKEFRIWAESFLGITIVLLGIGDMILTISSNAAPDPQQNLTVTGRRRRAGDVASVVSSSTPRICVRSSSQTSRSPAAAPAYSRSSGRSPRTVATGPSSSRMTSATSRVRGAPSSVATRGTEISVADVIRELEGPVATVRGERPDDLEYAGAAAGLRDVWLELRTQIRGVLKETTLADIAGAHRLGLTVRILFGSGAALLLMVSISIANT